jgi:hypothetical protein
MSRFRKPFFKKSHDCWYVQIEGRQIRLSKDRDEAFLLYHKMMINWYRFRRQSVVPFGRKLTLVLQQASCPWGRRLLWRPCQAGTTTTRHHGIHRLRCDRRNRRIERTFEKDWTSENSFGNDGSRVIRNHARSKRYCPF